MEDIARATPKIYAALDNHQAYHRSIVVEVEGKISKQSISVLINLGSTHSYVSPKVAENYSLGKEKHNKSWLVQLITRVKRKVSEVVMECPMELNGRLTKVNLNILRLETYDALFGMDCWKIIEPA